MSAAAMPDGSDPARRPSSSPHSSSIVEGCGSHQLRDTMLEAAKRHVDPRIEPISLRISPWRSNGPRRVHESRRPARRVEDSGWICRRRQAARASGPAARSADRAQLMCRLAPRSLGCLYKPAGAVLADRVAVPVRRAAVRRCLHDHGSNALPSTSFTICSASSSVRPLRYERSDVNASRKSATPSSRPRNGMFSPARPSG